MVLDSAGRSVFTESALGHSREDGNHGVRAIFLIHPREVDHLSSVLKESATQECVQEKYVTHLQSV